MGNEARMRPATALGQLPPLPPLAVLMAPTASRARPNARKRLDDSAFIGPSGTKRTLADRDGRQRDRDSATDDLARVKRKRTDQINLPAASSAHTYAQDDDSGLVVCVLLSFSHHKPSADRITRRSTFRCCRPLPSINTSLNGTSSRSYNLAHTL